MFAILGLGAWEIALIAGVLVVVAGPTLLPRLGRFLGQSFRGLREGAETFQASLREEIERDGKPQNQLPPRSAEESAEPKSGDRS